MKGTKFNHLMLLKPRKVRVSGLLFWTMENIRQKKRKQHRVYKVIVAISLLPTAL